MIQISNCPVTGLVRKLEYDFLILKTVRQIIIDCTVHYFNNQGVIVNSNGLKSYKRPLVASDSLINSQTGELDENGDITEFDYYDQLGNIQVAIYSQIENIILLRDSQGRFN